MDNQDNKNAVVDSTPTASQSQFASIVERIFKDPDFAEQLETAPEQALKSAGYALTPAQLAELQTAKANLARNAKAPLAIPLSIVPRPTSSDQSERAPESMIGGK